MNKYLNDLLIIDQEIGELFYLNDNLNDNELNNKFEEKNYINKALKLLEKLSSKNILELIKRSKYLNSFIDLKKFMKKYPINKTYLLHNKDQYIEEYKKLHKTCFYLSDISLDYNEFREYMNVLDVDNVEEYLLKHMPNDQIYKLALETGEWDEKLYLFSYFKKKEK